VSTRPVVGAARDVDLAGLARHVEDRLRSELPATFYYHDARHTLEDVVPAALTLAAGEGIVGTDLERLHAAALLHDIGYTRTAVDHEAMGAVMAAEIAPSFGFDDADVAEIARLILATRLGHVPRSVGEAVIADADLDVLGRRDFWLRHRALQRELAAMGQAHEEAEWIRMQARFLRGHTFHTRTARERGDAGKERNARRIVSRRTRLATLAEAGRRRPLR
jgi:uncharacterized protein